MNSNLDNCYNRPPLNIVDDIPIFSPTDFYIENYNRISSDHLKHFESTGKNPFMQEASWREMEKSTEILVRKYVNKSGMKILDVGVGMGRLLERFPNLRRYGMDISLGYLKYAEAKGIQVCMSRIEEMPYKEGFFDALVITDVLEHVLDVNLTVTKILSVVKECGYIIVRVPYKEDLDGYLQPDYPYDLVHLRNFDENSLRLLFEKIFNVKVIEWTFTGYRNGKLKVGNNSRLFRGIVRRLQNLLDKLNTRWCEYFSRKFCYPVEINMVICNSKCNIERL